MGLWMSGDQEDETWFLNGDDRLTSLLCSEENASLWLDRRLMFSGVDSRKLLDSGECPIALDSAEKDKALCSSVGT